MDLPSLPAEATRLAASAQRDTAAGAAKPAITSDFQTFLRMLTAQLRNQDPLNPIESSDYAVQLATFAGVEQQMRTNTLLGGLQQGFSLLGLSQLAGWVGQEALVDAPVAFDGTPVLVETKGRDGADRRVLTVRDAAGALVAREEVAAGATGWLWHGRDAAGAALPPGRYTLALESLGGEATLGTDPAPHYARIVEARNGAAGPVVVLPGGAEVAATSILALRSPTPG
jgi:flagellar basal-body rod modification protein FlgD